MEASDGLERLRALCHEPPTPQVWGELLALLQGWPRRTREVGLAYAEAHLARWPDALRVCPAAQLIRSDPRLDAVRGLFRALDTIAAHAHLSDRHLQSWAEAGTLDGFTRLVLGRGRVGGAGAAALAGRQELRPAHLDLSCNLLDDAALATLAEAPWIGALTHLDLRDNDAITPGGLWPLADALSEGCALLLSDGACPPEARRDLPWEKLEVNFTPRFASHLPTTFEGYGEDTLERLRLTPEDARGGTFSLDQLREAYGDYHPDRQLRGRYTILDGPRPRMTLSARTSLRWRSQRCGRPGCTHDGYTVSYYSSPFSGCPHKDCLQHRIAAGYQPTGQEDFEVILTMARDEHEPWTLELASEHDDEAWGRLYLTS